MGVQERLIEVPVVEGASEAAPTMAAVGKVFRDYQPGQSMLPPSLDEWLPAEHLARFVDELVETHLDLGPFYAAHTNVKGLPPYEPRMMLKVLLYGYLTGVRSSRKLETACVEQVAFRFLAASECPDHRASSRFRRRHLAAMDGLFMQVLGLCQSAGMVKLGNVGLDGTKVKANASRHKAMSYARMNEREPELAALVKQILDEAEQVDAEEDELYGDARGDELPEHLRTKQGRLVRSARRNSSLRRRRLSRPRRPHGPRNVARPNVAGRTPTTARSLNGVSRPQTRRLRLRCRNRRRNATSPIRSRGS